MRLMELAVLATLTFSSAVEAAGELVGGAMTFKGVVVALPCSIAPGSEKVPVDFGEISTKSLYATGKTTPIAFSIVLEDCNPSVFDSVTVTFDGDRNSNMTDRLAIKSVAPSGASGVGIGLEESDGSPIRLNTPTNATAITDTVMQLNFQAFVEGEPQALANGTLTTGAFTATANYTLNYQ
ncbi:fimbrial protein [Obesumbacterium proteus]|uniref:Fimbrial-type adhesion domain-containing protein n=1 Tax=Obesumbacterium proteus ATCC 12841 TaxID=1354268 RepID=A0AA91IMI9_9GAMM|nr:fimbrial protein [Obesumbacterium proteus]AMO81599.1 fimbrial protein [Obesumbacterium proteus]MCE9883504.1 type 1 fimbrial protein [Obesumbacterium proteus]MCE9916036.1 type 1 fimbrial protein [Obesumbacterium proteus]MCE9928588.1 type 1 fimbrial protein [Obesumbacterium proteus]MCG2877147.1 type 1 fimbrial protein [Obesumbacterium proteus]